MKVKAAICAGLPMVLAPALAWAAQDAEGGGSRLALVFFIINFAAFVFIVAFYAGPAATRFFRERAGQIRETFGRSNAAHDRAREMLTRAADRLARLENEKQVLAAEMRRDTDSELARTRDLAAQAANRIRRDGELTAGAVAEAGRQRIRARLVEVAAGLARDLIARNFDRSDQGRLLEDFMGRLGQETLQ